MAGSTIGMREFFSPAERVRSIAACQPGARKSQNTCQNARPVCRHDVDAASSGVTGREADNPEWESHPPALGRVLAIRNLEVVNRVSLFFEHVTKVPIGIEQRWRRAAERAVRLQRPYVQEKVNVDLWGDTVRPTLRTKVFVLVFLKGLLGD